MTSFLIVLAINLLIMIIVHIMDYDFHKRAGDDQEHIIHSQKTILETSWMPLINIYMLVATYRLHQHLNKVDDKLRNFNR